MWTPEVAETAHLRSDMDQKSHKICRPADRFPRDFQRLERIQSPLRKWLISLVDFALLLVLFANVAQR